MEKKDHSIYLVTDLKDLTDPRDMKDLRDLKDLKDPRDLKDLRELKDLKDPKHQLQNIQNHFKRDLSEKPRGNSNQENCKMSRCFSNGKGLLFLFISSPFHFFFSFSF